LLLPTYILIKQRRLKNNLLPAGKIGFASTQLPFRGSATSKGATREREQQMSGSNQ
jgi:hypothetical protein